MGVTRLELTSEKRGKEHWGAEDKWSEGIMKLSLICSLPSTAWSVEHLQTELPHSPHKKEWEVCRRRVQALVWCLA